jgi:hypothetical protein
VLFRSPQNPKTPQVTKKEVKFKSIIVKMSNNNKKDGDVEMKDSTVNGAADKKEEVKKEEPYDPFFGKAQSNE